MLTNNIIYGAGILFYSKSIDQTPYFFLGKDWENKWSNFGGVCEASDKFDTEITASRETWEETLGCIICKTPSGNPYYMYVVKIPFNNNYRYTFLSTKKFISKINIDKKFLEINDVKWVSYQTLKLSINSKKPLIKLRNIFEQTFSDNINEIDKIIS